MSPKSRLTETQNRTLTGSYCVFVHLEGEIRTKSTPVQSMSFPGTDHKMCTKEMATKSTVDRTPWEQKFWGPGRSLTTL